MQLRQSQASFGVDLNQSLFAAGFQDPTRTVRWNDSFERARRLNTTQMGMLLRPPIIYGSANPRNVD
jgi:hypothetical protein